MSEGLQNLPSRLLQMGSPIASTVPIVSRCVPPAENFCTRWLSVSATQMLPDPSTVTAAGRFIECADGSPMMSVKLIVADAGAAPTSNPVNMTAAAARTRANDPNLIAARPPLILV
jgi:hypothetical protein